jgi:hypothetical protein
MAADRRVRNFGRYLVQVYVVTSAPIYGGGLPYLPYRVSIDLVQVYVVTSAPIYGGGLPYLPYRVSIDLVQVYVVRHNVFPPLGENERGLGEDHPVKSRRIKGLGFGVWGSGFLPPSWRKRARTR